MTKNAAEQESLAKEGSVKYMDGSALLRPQVITGPIRVLAMGIVAVAIAVGGYAAYNVADRVLFAAAHEGEMVKKILAQETADDTPRLASFLSLDDEDTRAALGQQTERLYDVPQTGSSKAIDVIKLGQDADEALAANLYVSNGSGMSASNAMKALHGTWRFDVDRSNGRVLRVRYADFTSGSPEAAVRAAMSLQGFPEEGVTEAGLDDSGNTFKTGTAATEDGTTYTWRVSTIKLSEVYPVNGLPENAMFVGVRVY